MLRGVLRRPYRDVDEPCRRRCCTCELIGPEHAFDTMEDSSRSPIMRRLMSTAKTTLLPANHGRGVKKGLHSTTQ
jgi:hypothetical protein